MPLYMDEGGYLCPEGMRGVERGLYVVMLTLNIWNFYCIHFLLNYEGFHSDPERH